MVRRRKEPEPAPRRAWWPGLLTSWALVAVVGLVVYGGALFAGGYFTNELLGDGEESPAAVQSTVEPTAATSAISDELQALGEEWGQAMAKVSYNITSTSDDTTDESSVTLYWRPPDWRMDISSSSSEGDTILIATASALYWCGTESGTNQCLSYDPSQYDASAPLEMFDPTAAGLNLSGQNVDRSEQTMLGEAATCFSLSSTTEEGTSESKWCFASDGILLQFASTSDDPASGDFTIETIGVNRDVADADFDFQPPYPVSTQVPTASPTPVQ